MVKFLSHGNLLNKGASRFSEVLFVGVTSTHGDVDLVQAGYNEIQLALVGLEAMGLRSKYVGLLGKYAYLHRVASIWCRLGLISFSLRRYAGHGVTLQVYRDWDYFASMCLSTQGYIDLVQTGDNQLQLASVCLVESREVALQVCWGYLAHTLIYTGWRRSCAD